MNRIFPALLACILGFTLCDKLSGQDAKPTPYSERSAAGLAGTNSMDALDTKRKLIINDRISYRVVEERTPAAIELTVADSGEVEVPLIGRVAAAGKSCRELADDVKKALEKDYFYKATVIIGLNAASKQSRGMIYLMGPVAKQGPMEIPVETPFTMSKAIMRAGGFAEFADKRNVKLIRKTPEGTENSVFDMDTILKGKPGKDPELQPDDIIMVREKFINF